MLHWKHWQNLMMYWMGEIRGTEAKEVQVGGVKPGWGWAGEDWAEADWGGGTKSASLEVLILTCFSRIQAWVLYNAGS